MSKVSFASHILLDDFGYHLHNIFGDWPYHVGSSVLSSVWNDVDVRIILDDEVYERLGYGDPAEQHHNERWVSTCLALSLFGRTLTGLPIDCQIQQQSDANRQFSQKQGCVRSALGIRRQMRTQP